MLGRDYEDEERAAFPVKLWKTGRGEDEEEVTPPEELMKAKGVTFQCIGNRHHKKVVSVAEAGNMVGQPTCEKCGALMLATKVVLDNARKKKPRK